MLSHRALVFVFVLTLSGVLGDSGTGSSFSGNLNPDKSGPELTDLYNSRVMTAEKMVRPKEGFERTYGPISHSGVRVTLENGDQYLIHKGPKNGISSQTVVVDAKHMSNRWRTTRTKNFDGERTVSDFVRTGGRTYNALLANCHLAANAMMRQRRRG